MKLFYKYLFYNFDIFRKNGLFNRRKNYKNRVFYIIERRAVHPSHIKATTYGGVE